MKQLLTYLLLLCPLFVSADELNAILDGEYKPVLMSEERQDSLLNGSVGVPEGEGWFSADRFRLEYENKKQIYRHSFEANYYIVDTKKDMRVPICDDPVREAKLSPNGRYVAYVKDNNLYIFKVDYLTEVPITTNNGARTVSRIDGTTFKEPRIFNGVADWLYEEEFGVTSLFEFSPDSKRIAFLRLNEENVKVFAWQNYLDGNYPQTQTIRYPKAGERNPQVSLFVYDIFHKSTHQIELPNTDDCYIPRIKWETPEPVNPKKSEEDAPVPRLIIQKVNRDQTNMEVFSVNPKSTTIWPLYKEKSGDYYMDYSLFDQWVWLSDKRFIVLSEKAGWKSIYLYSEQGQELRQLTPDGLDVTKIYGVDEKNGLVYYQAATTPLTRQCYVCNLKQGQPSMLTTGEGIHDLRFSKDWTRVIDNFESSEIPNQYTLYENKKGSLRFIELVHNNDSLLARWKESGLPDKQFLTFGTERNDRLNAWMILPPALTASEEDTVPHEPALDKYPCVLMQYSGPESQRVLNRWRKGFGHYLASQGYVVICSDGRGTGCRGRAWRNETYMNLGQKEADDQISTARFAASLAFVDPNRIAIIGWSYGGYQAIRTLCEKDNGLKCAVAIAPVTDWRLYDSGYTERFMRRPQVNENGYKKADLIPLADRLKGDLLIVHGLADDNVHAQHTLKFVDALVQAGKQFEMQIYPDDNHFLRKRSNYEHLHRRIMLFLDKELKP